MQKFDKPGSDKVAHEETFEFASKLVGGGWHFQADEVARCIRDGKLESETWGPHKTLLQMEIFDEVRRPVPYVDGARLIEMRRYESSLGMSSPRVLKRSCKQSEG